MLEFQILWSLFNFQMMMVDANVELFPRNITEKHAAASNKDLILCKVWKPMSAAQLYK